MPVPLSPVRTAVFQKAVMAVTGIILFAWVFAHMAGNLKIFAGRESFNHYSEFLRAVGAPLAPESSLLWLARVVLLFSVVLHIWAAAAVTRRSQRARPEAYREWQGVQLDYAARTMRTSGVLIAVYVVYHLMHLTFGTVHSEFVAHDPYANVVRGFQVLPVSLVYMMANVLLGLHLYHGLWSMFQSLGWNHPAYNRTRNVFAVTFSIAVSLGFISVPLAVLIGLVS